MKMNKFENFILEKKGMEILAEGGVKIGDIKKALSKMDKLPPTTFDAEGINEFKKLITIAKYFKCEDKILKFLNKRTGGNYSSLDQMYKDNKKIKIGESSVDEGIMDFIRKSVENIALGIGFVTALISSSLMTPLGANMAAGAKKIGGVAVGPTGISHISDWKDEIIAKGGEVAGYLNIDSGMVAAPVFIAALTVTLTIIIYKVLRWIANKLS